MQRRRMAAFLALFLALSSFVSAQAHRPAAPASTPTHAEKPPEKKDEKSSKPAEKAEPEPVVTRHEIRSGGKVLRYAVTTGTLPLKNEDGETEANIFFMAYTLDGQEAGKRPLMFSFNGGPGSSSVWLHLGALGPKRVRMESEGFMPAPPYQLVENEYTWLDLTDLVFIDPVGTGYSRATKKDLGKKFWGLQGDLNSVGEFIRLYLSRYQRWPSPLFLVGESYGTTRAAGLSGLLVEKGIAFNGVLLVSSILNFQTARFTAGNDLPYILFLPTYTATAFYHKKLPAELQTDLRKTLQEAEAWAAGAYQDALAKGDRLSTQERDAIASQLARFTGLSKAYVENNNLRIAQPNFTKELLREQHRVVGRLDARFTGADLNHADDSPSYDPSMSAIRPPYTAALNNYVRGELGYKSDLEYYILGGGIAGPWEYPQGQFPDTSEALRQAFVKQPYMKLFVGSGYFDMATPYFATEYTLNHLSLDPAARKNVTQQYYEAGHMMYIQERSLEKLKRDVAAFIQSALKP